MNKNINRLLMVLLGTCFLVAGCHTTKKVTEKKPPSRNMSWSKKKIISAIEEHYIDFHTLSARLHMDYKKGKQQYHNVTTYIRMKKDSAIWLSVRPLLGIEMMRILITPDSIKLHNNIKNRRIVRSIDDMKEVLHVPVDFSVIQSLIIGNIPSVPDRIKAFKIDSSSVRISQIGSFFKSTYQWSSAKFLLQKSHYQLLKSTKYAEQQYFDYQKFSVGEVSLDRKIRVKDASEMKIHLTFDKIKFNIPVSFPFP